MSAAALLGTVRTGRMANPRAVRYDFSPESRSSWSEPEVSVAQGLPAGRHAHFVVPLVRSSPSRGSLGRPRVTSNVLADDSLTMKDS